MLGIIGALAQLAPSIISLFDSDDESTVSKAVKTVSEVAQVITGQASDVDALEVLKADPELLVKYQEAMNGHAAALYAAETQRLRIVNKTYQTELRSGDRFVRWMRPCFGYIMAASFGATMFAVSKTILFSPAETAVVVASVADLASLYLPGLAVLGVYVHGRSREKMGQPGLLDTLISRFKKG